MQPHDLMPFIAQRYQLISRIGKGGMGKVYRALDRLRSCEVALKHVRLASERSAAMLADNLVLLATEFRTLAGLRHPHIISVLDYGFDPNRQPFYTMELLEGASSLLEAGRTLPANEQIRLLLQALEAVAYLHRRGVLHHDLKPENILFAAGSARLLDFGLAVLADQPRADDTFGTIKYLAPEVLKGAPYTESADLYSLGVIAYELLIDRHPFPATGMRPFLRLVASEPPDLSGLVDRPALADVIGQLLAKTPQGRPPSAQAAISLLRTAVGLPVAGVDPSIRESYLQAAKFVGRTQELAQLSDALAEAQRGQGSAWLIGGESGVGKSRLVEELRTRALVDGFRVLSGQEVEVGGQPYHIWRSPLRQLSLDVEPDVLAAGVLLDIIPSLSELLGRPIAPPPLLDARAGRERLSFTIVDLFHRQTAPTLLILEDLQWTSDGLEPLRLLSKAASNLPLCVVATYRDDERPELPKLLPDFQRQIALARLSADDIAALCGSIMGAAGSSAPVVEFLQRQTEGNVFFLVEVIRALAEEAGDLEEIARRALPQSVLTGGVVQIVRRRISRVPSWGQAPLRLAAVIGRQINVALLTQLCPNLDVERWLLIASDAAVLEAGGGAWRFRHDKLREAVLADLSAADRRRLHRRVALALESQPSDDGGQLAALFEHWRAAGRWQRASGYAQRAARTLIDRGAYGEARALIDRALGDARSKDAGVYLNLLVVAGEACRNLSDYTSARQSLEQAAALAAAARDERRLADALYQLASVKIELGQHTEAFEQLAQAGQIWERTGDRLGLARRLLLAGAALQHQGRIVDALQIFKECLELFREVGDRHGIAECLINLGTLRLRTGAQADAWQQLNDGVALAEQIADRSLQYLGLNQLAILAIMRGELGRAGDLQRQALQIARDTGRRRAEVTSLINLGNVYARQASFAEGVRCWEESLRLARQINARSEIGISLINLAEIHLSVKGDTRVEEDVREALAIMRSVPNGSGEAYALHLLGDVALTRRDLDEAARRYADSRAKLEVIGNPGFLLGVLTKLGKLAYVRGDVDQARSLINQSLDIARRINNRLEIIDNLAQLASLELRAGHPGIAAQALGEGLGVARAAPTLTVINNLLISLAEWYIDQGDAPAAHEAVLHAHRHPMLTRFIKTYRLPTVIDALARAPTPPPMPDEGEPGPRLERIIARGLAAIQQK